MAAVILTARQRNAEILVRVHIDTTKLVNGQPDPHYVITRHFPYPGPANMTAQQYKDEIRARLRQMVKRELDLRLADFDGTDIGLDGQAP